MRRALSSLALASLLAACGARTGLDRPPPPDADLDAFAPPDANLDAGTDAPIPDGCSPSPETCDGLDEDCDGVADDGVVCWTLDGAPIEAITTDVCARVFYSYDTPETASANLPVPGIVQSNRVEIVVIETSRSCGGGALAVIADQVDDGAGGSLLGSFRFDRDDGEIVVEDDPRECVYDRRTREGHCNWGWQACCTDGVMLGPFPGDQCLELTIEGQEGRPIEGVDALVATDGPTAVRPLDFGTAHRFCRRAVPAR